MEWYEDPVRARDAVRAAAWRGAWRMLGVLFALLVLAAILYPAFAQMKVGPKLTPRSIASATQKVRRETGKWPTAFEPVASSITFDDRIGPHHVGFVKLGQKGNEAEYAIAFDRSLKVFQLDSEFTIAEVGKPAYGVLPK